MKPYPRSDGGVSEEGNEYRYGRNWSSDRQLPPRLDNLIQERIIGERPMAKPKITMAEFLEIGGNNDFDTAVKLFGAFDSQSFLSRGEERWGKNFAQNGFMHSTDHRAALIKILGHEPMWLAVYDSWSAGDAIPTQARLMDPDDGTLVTCLIRQYNSISRGMKEWGSIISTGKLSNGKPVTGVCVSRIIPAQPPVKPPIEPPIKPPITSPIDPPITPVNPSIDYSTLADEILSTAHPLVILLLKIFK